MTEQIKNGSNLGPYKGRRTMAKHHLTLILVSVDANVTRLVLVIGAVIAAIAKKIFHFLVWSRLNQAVCLVARNVEIYPKLKLAFGLVTQNRPVHSCKFFNEKVILNQLSFLANIMVFN